MLFVSRRVLFGLVLLVTATGWAEMGATNTGEGMSPDEVSYEISLARMRAELMTANLEIKLLKRKLGADGGDVPQLLGVVGAGNEVQGVIRIGAAVIRVAPGDRISERWSLVSVDTSTAVLFDSEKARKLTIPFSRPSRERQEKSGQMVVPARAK